MTVDDLTAEEIEEMAAREVSHCDRCETSATLYLVPQAPWDSVCRICYVEIKGEQSDLRRWSA